MTGASQFGPASSEDDPSRDLDGTQYRFIALLGSGAMGDVLEAEHATLGTRVAVKLLKNLVLNPGDLARMQDRMRIEAQACARLEHPNLLKVLDFGVTPQGRTFLVSERLVGRTLREELEERSFLPVLEALSIASATLAGLEVAHQASIVHRDIKPDNIFLTNAVGGVPRGVKLLDFGLAKVVDAARDPNTPAPLAIPTATGMSLGTPRFMAPEQATGKRNIDRRVDLYGVGGVLYTMVAGRGAFDHYKTVYEIMKAQVSEAPQAPSQFAPQSIPPDLDRALLRALSKDPAQRFQTARDFADELQRIRVSLARQSLASDPGRQSPTPQRWEVTEPVETLRARSKHPPTSQDPRTLQSSAHPAPPTTFKGTEMIDTGAALAGARGALPFTSKGTEMLDTGAILSGAHGAPPFTSKGTEMLDTGAIFRDPSRDSRASFPGVPPAPPAPPAPPPPRVASIPPTASMAAMPPVPRTLDLTASSLRVPSAPTLGTTLDHTASAMSIRQPTTPRKSSTQQRILVVVAVLAILALGVAAAIAILRM